jgi:hypothetical protein
MPLLTLISGPVIASGESLSSILNASTGNTGLQRITMPAAWNSSAWLTFQVSQDGASFSDLYWPHGAPVVVTVVPGTTIVTDPAVWQAGWFRFRSGTASNPIPQIANRNFSCMLN